MEIYTIGFVQKPAEKFFGDLRQAGIRRLVDVRIHNTSQLSGYTKRVDLVFFLRELCNAEYVYEPLLAPTAEMLADYRSKKLSWTNYERLYRELLVQRQVARRLSRESFESPSVLLCSELLPDYCHRRLAADYLANAWGATVTHL